MADTAAVAEALAAHGLILRGGFIINATDEPLTGPNENPARSVLLIGNAGASHWPYFRTWLAGQGRDVANPLDTWTRAVVEPLAARFGARAAFPFDKPYLPFQRWAMRAEGLRASPLGIVIHPEYGLWHAYRAALLFDAEISIQASAEAIHLCDLCDGKPCLKSCPVGAYSVTGFAYRDCVAHVRGAGAECLDSGCLDRNACPYGTKYRYPAEVQAFHMAAFSRAAA